ncbi:MAG: oligopeptide/dipeptide ABC transporter ATP-binding protein [Acidimicrobiales bacterium]|nr:oligopeptide/dipeptide ABC transporter ATP-binding protein [Acidimicrobiales bacterium]
MPGRPPNLISPPTGCDFAPRCRYAQERCLEEEPPLTEGETPGHHYRCFFPVGTEAGNEALERNIAEGRTTPATASTVDVSSTRSAADGRIRHRSPPRPRRRGPAGRGPRRGVPGRPGAHRACRVRRQLRCRPG